MASRRQHAAPPQPHGPQWPARPVIHHPWRPDGPGESGTAIPGQLRWLGQLTQRSPNGSCIKAKGVLAMAQRSQAGPSDALENHDKPGIRRPCCLTSGQSGGPARVGQSLNATVPRQRVTCDPGGGCGQDRSGAPACGVQRRQVVEVSPPSGDVFRKELGGVSAPSGDLRGYERFCQATEQLPQCFS